MDYRKLADLLFPHITKTPQDYEAVYPPRQLPEGARVTRLAPSPTGFIHLGNLYSAFVDERLAHQSGGIFFLRIEDTDDKRFVEGAVETIVGSLDYFGIEFDEGASVEGESGEYGPYHQSRRAELYQACVKQLVQQGHAYPCFLTEEELSEIRAKQEAEKQNPGIYGRWAVSRSLSYEEIEEKLKQGVPYVVRLKSSGKTDVPAEEMDTITVSDAIRGEITMPANNMDIVILKATGIPTYHFAHVVDDHYMRTTHVVRGEEWLSSLPVHIELFGLMGWQPPVYCHTAHLMKIGEEGTKRKLSKRKDPELSLDYYRRDGYYPPAVREYLMTLLNSNFEEWRIANPEESLDAFAFSTEKMSNSGALFDLDKLRDVCKDVLVRVPASELAAFLKKWAGESVRNCFRSLRSRKSSWKKFSIWAVPETNRERISSMRNRSLSLSDISSTIISSSKESFRRTFPPKMHRRFCSGIWPLMITAMIRAHGLKRSVRSPLIWAMRQSRRITEKIRISIKDMWAMSAR